jgi:DNA-binding MarR family transcriptional regulator
VATREGILCSDSVLDFCTQIKNMRKAYSADLPLRQLAILLICSSSTQGLTGSQLALELNLTPSVVTRAVARMVSRALLVRVMERDRGGRDLIFASSRGRDFARRAALRTPI